MPGRVGRVGDTHGHCRGEQTGCSAAVLASAPVLSRYRSARIIKHATEINVLANVGASAEAARALAQRAQDTHGAKKTAHIPTWSPWSWAWVGGEWVGGEASKEPEAGRVGQRSGHGQSAAHEGRRPQGRKMTKVLGPCMCPLAPLWLSSLAPSCGAGSCEGQCWARVPSERA